MERAPAPKQGLEPGRPWHTAASAAARREGPPASAASARAAASARFAERTRGRHFRTVALTVPAFVGVAAFVVVAMLRSSGATPAVAPPSRPATASAPSAPSLLPQPSALTGPDDPVDDRPAMPSEAVSTRASRAGQVPRHAAAPPPIDVPPPPTSTAPAPPPVTTPAEPPVRVPVTTPAKAPSHHAEAPVEAPVRAPAHRPPHYPVDPLHPHDHARPPLHRD
jgi:hypothetical protein